MDAPNGMNRRRRRLPVPLSPQFTHKPQPLGLLERVCRLATLDDWRARLCLSMILQDRKVCASWLETAGPYIPLKQELAVHKLRMSNLDGRRELSMFYQLTLKRLQNEEQQRLEATNGLLRLERLGNLMTSRKEELKTQYRALCNELAGMLETAFCLAGHAAAKQQLRLLEIQGILAQKQEEQAAEPFAYINQNGSITIPIGRRFTIPCRLAESPAPPRVASPRSVLSNYSGNSSRRSWTRTSSSSELTEAAVTVVPAAPPPSPVQKLHSPRNRNQQATTGAHRTCEPTTRIQNVEEPWYRCCWCGRRCYLTTIEGCEAGLPSPRLVSRRQEQQREEQLGRSTESTAQSHRQQYGCIHGGWCWTVRRSWQTREQFQPRVANTGDVSSAPPHCDCDYRPPP